MTVLAADVAAQLRRRLVFLYGDDVEAPHAALLARLEAFATARGRSGAPASGGRLDEGEVVLITYADTFRAPGEAPLATLRGFLRRHVGDAVRTVHLLPFYPWTSDDGFSVVDDRAVDPQVGGWADVEALGHDHALMFDAVLNHASASSRAFRGFLADEPAYRDFFVTADPTTDLSAVVRPRTSPLLTPFTGTRGTVHVWTTFSADQVDRNYANPAVLLDLVDVLLTYVERGARILRLDAITYLWKEVGTPCVHHAKTHGVLRLLRTAIDAVAPEVVLLTETNVPHHENVGYFGDGHDEAAMVYNFALPPLTLHAFLRGDARALGAWAADVRTPSDATTFLNFLASHDGIGLRPVEALLPEEEVAAVVHEVERRGGLVSYRSAGSGARPYELNVALFDALSDPASGEPLDRAVDRFVAAHAVMASLAGVPAVYVQSLLGSRNDRAAVAERGYARAINRSRFDLPTLEGELADPTGRRARVLARLTRLLRVRRRERAFHPQAHQRVLDLEPGVFAVRRTLGERRLLALVDVAGAGASFPLPALAEAVGWDAGPVRDLVSGATLDRRRDARLRLAPYGVGWWAEADPAR